MDAVVNTVAKSEEGLKDENIPSLRERYGYNELPIPPEHPLRAYLKNFWGPLPWLMELLIVISILSGQKIEGLVIVFLLFINSGVSTLQRRSTDAALATLTAHLTIFARVKRNGVWQSMATRELVPGDIVRVRSGDIVPADATSIEGSVSVDLSSLTGESLPRDVEMSEALFSGSVIKRGEATARVTATGKATAYGKTTELLETSHPPTHMEKIIFSVIRFFFVFNILLAIAVTVFGILVHAPTADIVNFVLVLLITSVPIAFPTMFAVAQSYGALNLSKDKRGGVLVRRLAAVQECATVDVLCSDKTGTLTENKLQVSTVTRYGDATEAEVLAYAVASGNEADEDSIDMAILQYAKKQSVSALERHNFIPFNSQTKCTEVDITFGGISAHVRMGLPELLLTDGVVYAEEAKQDLAHFSADGLRVVAIVLDVQGTQTCPGIIGLADPLRSDASHMIQELHDLGVRLIMITGDGRTTARAVAAQLGLQGAVVTPSELHADPDIAVKASVFAETYPEDKLVIIRALQQAGHVVAMTGDGVNDAPALRQAEVGIAVADATDVAKQSASFILTDAGLEGVVRAVQSSREVYTRLRAWALNKIVKSFEVSLFTTVIFLITHSYIFSPLLAVLLLFANDFVTISIATDNAQPLPRPGRWRIGHLMLGALLLSVSPLLILSCVYLVVHLRGYPVDVMRTAVYLTLVWCGVGTLYAIRAWPHAWNRKPSTTLLYASLFSCVFAFFVAVVGIVTSSLPLSMIAIIFIGSVISFFLTDYVKSTHFVQHLLIAS